MFIQRSQSKCVLLCHPLPLSMSLSLSLPCFRARCAVRVGMEDRSRESQASWYPSENNRVCASNARQSMHRCLCDHGLKSDPPSVEVPPVYSTVVRCSCRRAIPCDIQPGASLRMLHLIVESWHFVDDACARPCAVMDSTGPVHESQEGHRDTRPKTVTATAPLAHGLCKVDR